MDSKTLSPNLSRFVNAIKRNLHRFENPSTIYDLEGSHGGRPAVIAGAGPSLALNARQLATAEVPAVFATDRARDRLMRLGVHIDFVVTADPSPATGSFITEPGIEKQILIASTYSSAEILDLPWKQIFFFNSSDNNKTYMEQVHKLCEHIPFIPGAILVSNFAFLAAAACGCAPIAFVGNDYCAVKPEKEWKDNPDYELLRLSDGTEYHTLKSFLLALDWMNHMLERGIAGRTLLPPVFNCSEAGIFYTKNIPGIPLSEFIEKYS